MNHCAIEIAIESEYAFVINHLMQGKLLSNFVALQNLKGALFSASEINNFILEEDIHSKYEITSNTNSCLKSMSSGEQKKALLQHILKGQPNFIVIENVFDNLDTASQKSIVDTLQNISTTILIIQIIKRRNDILPFVKEVYLVNENTVVQKITLQKYLADDRNSAPTNFNTSIPVALNSFTCSNPLVQLIDVSVYYDGRQILNKVNWTINKNEFWQLIGPNGSGKSTLLSLIIGDNPKGYGQNIFLFGHQKGSGESVWDIKKNIGYLTPNMTQFFPRLDTVEKMILSGFFNSIGLYHIPNETQIKVANDWLSTIGLSETKDKPFCFLTLCQQRMVMVARAMVKHPPLLILDEPTVDLDDKNAAIFVSLINKIALESTTAIIFVSHRKEPGLLPTYALQLLSTINGSIGKTVIL